MKLQRTKKPLQIKERSLKNKFIYHTRFTQLIFVRLFAHPVVVEHRSPHILEEMHFP